MIVAHDLRHRTTNLAEWVERVTPSWQFTTTVYSAAAAVGWIVPAALRRVVALNYDCIAASSVIVARHVAASRCVAAFPNRCHKRIGLPN